jgi:hypothetical protein
MIRFPHVTVDNGKDILERDMICVGRGCSAPQRHDKDLRILT